MLGGRWACCSEAAGRLEVDVKKALGMQDQQLTTGTEANARQSRPRHPILDLPLSNVIRTEYALQLQHVLKLYTVGNLLGAWRDLESQKCIEDVFDTPEQAHHAIATCAAWLGFQTVAAPRPVQDWWQSEEMA